MEDREPVDASLIVKPTDFVAVTLTDRKVNMSAVLRDTPFATDSIAINIDSGEAIIDTAFADDESTRRPIKPFIELVDASDNIRFKATAAKMSMDLARPTDRPAKIPHKYINDTVRAGDLAYGYTQNLYVATDYWQTGYTADDGTIITP